MGAFLDFSLRWDYKGKRGDETLFKQAFVDLRHELVDWSRAFRLIAEDVLEPFVEKQFETEGKSGGQEWQELAESTLRSRTNPAASILYQSRRLLGSFVEKGPEHVEDIGRQKLRWGSNVPYALFHHTGTGKGFQHAQGVATGPGTGRGMAMRPLFWKKGTPAGDKVIKKIRRTMHGRLIQAARQIGFGITAPSERAGLGAAEARQIGNILLGLRPCPALCFAPQEGGESNDCHAFRH